MTAYVQFDDVFGPARNRNFYELALSVREHFTQSRTSPSRDYPDWRRSNVVYDHQLTGVATSVEQLVRARLPQVVAALGVAEFDIGGMEVQLTSHNDGEYYHWHTDNSTPHTASRVVSFVYYLHSEPKRYSGGDLVVYGAGGDRTIIEPRNDSLIFFAASQRHEVTPVVVRTKRFEDGRFTINGWVRRHSRVPADDYFDAKIFTMPRIRTASPNVASSPSVVRSNGAAARQSAAMPGELANGLLDVYSRLFAQSAHARHVEVRTQVDASDFFENFYFTNRPVLLKGVMAHSPAVRQWSPDWFATHHGSVKVQITDGRERDPGYEQNFRRSLRTVTITSFVERLAREPVSNDYYLVARNFFFDVPALRSLRNDLCPPSAIVDVTSDEHGSTKLWFGPGCTVTPLHYDEHSVLFAQIFGRKHVKLIPPFDYRRVYARDRFYSDVDPEHADLVRHPEFASASVADVFVEPGDVLFLPVGWWHWAKSLDVSISATFSSFRVPDRNSSLQSSR